MDLSINIFFAVFIKTTPKLPKLYMQTFKTVHADDTALTSNVVTSKDVRHT